MNDFRKITRIILIFLGLYILVNTGMVLFLTLPPIIFTPWPTSSPNVSAVLLPMCAIGYAVLIVYLLLRKADFWAEKVVGSEEPTESHPKVFWMPVAFRLVSVLAGILYLYWVVPSIISTVRSYLAVKEEGIVVPASNFNLVQVVNWVILLALGIYLLCGAPHFVRWQVKKTLKQCKELEEFVKAGEEGSAEPTQS